MKRDCSGIRDWLRLAKYIYLDLPDRCMEFNAQLYPPKKCGRSFYQKA